MEDGLDALLELAADTETLRDSLADVDLSSGEAEDGEPEDEEEQQEEEGPRGPAVLQYDNILPSVMAGREELNTLKSSGPLHFVVLQRLGATEGSTWMLPTVQQFHDGLGFLTNHGLLSNTFEFSLQQVNPKLTLPYWDFTIESSSTGAAAYEDLDDVFGSSIKTPLFQDSWFGTTDPETNMVR